MKIRKPFSVIITVCVVTILFLGCSTPIKPQVAKNTPENSTPGNTPEIVPGEVKTEPKETQIDETDSKPTETLNGEVDAEPKETQVAEVDSEPVDTLIDKPFTITDIAAWKHPIKKVLEDSGITITKMELYKDKTYPVIYFESEWGLNADTRSEYISMLYAAAKANGYWSFELNNHNMDRIIEVICNPEHNGIKKIRVNGEDLIDAAEGEPEGENQLASEDEAIQYLLNQVQEIKEYQKLVTDAALDSGTPGNKPIIRVDAAPDPNAAELFAQNFYEIYVGETTDTHTNRFATFYVRKDLQEILADNPETGDTVSLEKWRAGRKTR